MNELLAEAKAMVIQYAKNVEGKNLDEILEALSEDVQMKMQDNTSLEGKTVVRDFYEKRFAKGDYQFSHEFIDEKVVSDLIFINGKLVKIYIPTDKQTETNCFDFSFILKKETGMLKIWQLRIV